MQKEMSPIIQQPRDATSLVTLFSILYFLFSFLPAFAQDAAGVKIQPTLIEERVDAGETFSSVLRITNLSDRTEDFSLTVRDISRIKPDGTPEFVTDSQEATGFELSSWVKLDRNSITIGAGKTGEVPFSVVVPPKASPGGHFGGIIAATKPPELKEIGATVSYGATTVIALRVGGEVVEGVTVREFRTEKSVYTKPEVKFIARLENTGNALLRPRGPVEIVDFWGKKVATLVLNESGAGILPKAIRQFEVDWRGEGLAVGRYQVVMSLGYGEDGKETITEYLSFWVLPTQIIYPAAAGIIGLILLLVILVKFQVRRKVREMRRLAGERGGRSASFNEQAVVRRSPLGGVVITAVSVLIVALVFLVLIFFFFA